MKRIFVCVMVSMAFGISVNSQEIPSKDEWILLEPQNEQIKIYDESDGAKQSFQIQYSGSSAAFVPVYEIPVQNIENCVLDYSAMFRGANLIAEAYLEMDCVFDGKAFFSRDVYGSIRDDADWRKVSTPFYLKKGEAPDKVLLGVRIIGSGQVWLNDIELNKRRDSWLNHPEKWVWIPGTFFGVLAGLFGSLSGMLAPRGKCKGLVLGYGLAMIGISIVMLIGGVIALLMGLSWVVWYALLLPGVLGCAIIIPIMRNILWQYNHAELRRMQAMDVVDSV